MVEKSDPRLWGGLSILGALLVLGLFIQNGLPIGQTNVLMISGVALMISFILGMGVGDWFYDDVTKKAVSLSVVSLFIGAVIAGLVLPYTSTAFGDVAGFGAQTEAPPAEEPAFPSYMRGSVVNALSSPQVAISDAAINYYDTEPEAGVGQVALYTDNTDSSGSFMTEVKESEGTLLWATASKSNYYAEKDSGMTGESGSGATNLTFNDYGNGLTEIGALSKRITNAEPSENIAISGGDIYLDNAADTTFTFDLVIEDSTPATALRNLHMAMEEGSAYDNEAVEMEVIEVENPDYGTLSAPVVGGKLVWSNGVTETEIQCDGDLQYRKDLVIRFTIDSDDATTGTIINFEGVDDLSGNVGIEDESGISAQSFEINNGGIP